MLSTHPRMGPRGSLLHIARLLNHSPLPFIIHPFRPCVLISSPHLWMISCLEVGCCRQGVILYGEPGTGKTLLAKAVANQTSATFLRVVGSELIQKYLGDGPRLVRELFRVAEELSPTIVFIGGGRPFLAQSKRMHTW